MHNIESKKFPGHEHYVGYGDGVWHIHKYGSGATTWRAHHRDGKHPPVHGATLKDISEHLSKHASNATSQHSEEVEPGHVTPERAQELVNQTPGGWIRR